MGYRYLLSGLLLTVLLLISITAQAGGPAGSGVCVGGDKEGEVCLTMAPDCPGGFCSLHPQYCRSGPDEGLICQMDDECIQSECVEIGRAEGVLPHVCRSGPNKGEACRRDDDCSGSRCALDLRERAPIKGILTLIVDDDQERVAGIVVAPCPGLSTERGTTILLEVSKDGQPHFFAQTFRCLNGGLGDLSGISFLVTEAFLNDSVDNTSILNLLLFRRLGSVGDMEQALRTLFDSMGRPYIIGTPKVINAVKQSDNEGTTLASVVRLEVTIGFLPVP